MPSHSVAAVPTTLKLNPSGASASRASRTVTPLKPCGAYTFTFLKRICHLCHQVAFTYFEAENAQVIDRREGPKGHFAGNPSRHPMLIFSSCEVLRTKPTGCLPPSVESLDKTTHPPTLWAEAPPGLWDPFPLPGPPGEKIPYLCPMSRRSYRATPKSASRPAKEVSLTSRGRYHPHS